MTQMRVRHLVEKKPRPAKCGAMVWFCAASSQSRPCLTWVDSVEKGSDVLGSARRLSICETAFSFFTYSLVVLVVASVALAVASRR